VDRGNFLSNRSLTFLTFFSLQLCASHAIVSNPYTCLNTAFFWWIRKGQMGWLICIWSAWLCLYSVPASFVGVCSAEFIQCTYELLGVFRAFFKAPPTSSIAVCNALSLQVLVSLVLCGWFFVSMLFSRAPSALQWQNALFKVSQLTLYAASDRLDLAPKDRLQSISGPEKTRGISDALQTLPLLCFWGKC